MNNKEIRWKQRFENFEKAFLQLKDAVDRYSSLDDLSKEGLIQRFEYTLELAWKTLKDYNEAQGFITKSPREAIKQAFQTNVVDNREIWLEMLEKRDLLAHTYNEKKFNEALTEIYNSYFKEIENLYKLLKSEK